MSGYLASYRNFVVVKNEKNQGFYKIKMLLRVNINNSSDNCLIIFTQ